MKNEEWELLFLILGKREKWRVKSEKWKVKNRADAVIKWRMKNVEWRMGVTFSYFSKEGKGEKRADGI